MISHHAWEVTLKVGSLFHEMQRSDALSSLMQSVVLSPASPAPCKPRLAHSPEVDVQVVEVSPQSVQHVRSFNVEELDRQSISPRQPSSHWFALSDDHPPPPVAGQTYNVAVSPLLPRQRVLIRHIDASEVAQEILSVSPLCSKFGEPQGKILDCRAEACATLSACKNTGNGAVSEITNDAESEARNGSDCASRNQPLILPPRTSFVRVSRHVHVPEAPQIVLKSIAIPEYSAERDLMLLVKSVVGEHHFQSRSSSNLSESTSSVEWLDRANRDLKRPGSSMIPVSKVCAPDKPPAVNQQVAFANSSRFQIAALRETTTNCQEKSPEPAGCHSSILSKSLSFWCMKHHSSRVGTARRLLQLDIDSECVTIAMRRPDGTPWKGPDSPLQARGDPQAVRLCRNEAVEIVSGIAAYCHPGIHRTKVACPAHCLVVSRRGAPLACVEMISETELEACVKVLKSVC